MRDFFIQALDKIVGVLVVLGFLTVIGVAAAALFGGPQGGGLGGAIAILIGGTIYVVVMAGLMYLFLGIYANTKRMADAMDRSIAPRADL